MTRDGLWVRWVAAQRLPTVADAVGIDATVRLGALLTEPRSQVTRLPVRLGTGSSLEDLRRAIPALRSGLHCARVEVEPDPTRGDRAVVVASWHWSPPSTPYPNPPTQLALFPPDYCRSLPLGTGRDGEPIGVTLFDPEAGAGRLLIGGVPGSGKTNAMRTVLAGLAPTTTQFVFIDPAGGAEATRWADRCTEVVNTAAAAPTIAALSEVLALIERRTAAIAQGAEGFGPVLVVVDELAELAAAGTPKEQDHARTLLRRICALGRKANVGALLATQRTTATSIDTSTRAYATWRLALAHPGDRHGSEALLGPGHHEAADLSASDIGAGFLSNGGIPTLVAVHETTPDRALAESVPAFALTLAELAAWDSVAGSL